MSAGYEIPEILKALEISDGNHLIARKILTNYVNPLSSSSNSGSRAEGGTSTSTSTSIITTTTSTNRESSPEQEYYEILDKNEESTQKNSNEK